jgi:hypothetical protein
MTSQADSLHAQLEHLRGLYVLLGTHRDTREHDDLIERARAAIAEVRRTRARLAAPAVSPASGPVECSVR